MKLYVIPCGRVCEGKCAFCITKFRKTSFREFLQISDLEGALGEQKYTKIEITGGGEPTRNQELSGMIKLCASVSKTNLYTHGFQLETRVELEALESLSELCVSRAHYSSNENLRIMGLNCDLGFLNRLSVPLKFSLMLHESGISSAEEVLKYFEWARENGAYKVVVRQLFNHNYLGKLSGEYVSAQKVCEELGFSSEGESCEFDYSGLKVEFEFRECSCSVGNPVLHSDGIVRPGWEVLNDSHRGRD